jgi:hypothetical protein
MTALQGGPAVRSRTADYEWRAFPREEPRPEAHAYRTDQLDSAVLLLTPWCEEGSPFPLGHDRHSVRSGPAAANGRIACCVRCVSRWNAAVLEAANATTEVAR